MLTLRDQDERAALVLGVGIDTRRAQLRAEFVRGLFAADVETALAAREPAPDVVDGGVDLFLARAEERADVVALLVDDAGSSIHARDYRPARPEATSAGRENYDAADSASICASLSRMRAPSRERIIA